VPTTLHLPGRLPARPETAAVVAAHRESQVTDRRLVFDRRCDRDRGQVRHALNGLLSLRQRDGEGKGDGESYKRTCTGAMPRRYSADKSIELRNMDIS
jgi:hypothetical protein